MKQTNVHEVREKQKQSHKVLNTQIAPMFPLDHDKIRACTQEHDSMSKLVCLSVQRLRNLHQARARGRSMRLNRFVHDEVCEYANNKGNIDGETIECALAAAA